MTTTTATIKRTTATTAPKASVKSAVKAPAKAQAETSAAITKAQAKALDLLVSAVKAGITAYTEADSLADSHRLTALTQKVLTARAIGKLADHPATKATRGTKAGEPALTKIATLTGYAPSTLEPLFKGAMALRKAGMHKRTTAPSDAERDIVSGFVKSEAERAQLARAAKGKGKSTNKPGNKPGTKATFATLLGQATALSETIAKFTADQGFTNAQADELATALDSIHDMIEKATAK